MFAHAQTVYRSVYRCQPLSGAHRPKCGLAADRAVYPAVRELPQNLGVPEKSFGDVIREARVANGMDELALAQRVKKGISTIKRWEASENKPKLDDFNLLVAALPLSGDKLLLAMGYRLSPPEAALLPTKLLEAAARLSPRRLATLEDDALGLLLLEDSERRDTT